jgi:hypothetical protein
MLVLREALLQKKVDAELRKAQEFVRAKNKAAALKCLKLKKMYEAELGRLGEQQLRMHAQINLIEGTRAAAEMTGALRVGAAAMAKITRETNIDKVDALLEDLQEQAERVNAVQDALAAPLSGAADDEEELDAELAVRPESKPESKGTQPKSNANVPECRSWMRWSWTRPSWRRSCPPRRSARRSVRTRCPPCRAARPQPQQAAPRALRARQKRRS